MNNIKYYNDNAVDFFNNTVGADMKKCHDIFLKYVPARCRILDAGCGSGRDSKFFLEKGYTVCAIDASEKMCKLASAYIGQTVRNICFEELDYQNEFDGVWACASLLHVAKEKLPGVMEKLKFSLRDNGILYASFKYGTDERISNGRSFSDFTECDAVRLFEDAGFKVLECFVTEDVREERKGECWINVFGMYFSNYDIENILDETDEKAKTDSARMTHDEVFGSLHKKVKFDNYAERK